MKVSVIVPCYNHSVFIEDCLASVVKQTFKDFEILLVDDQSQDNTLEKGTELLISTGVEHRAWRNPRNLGTYGTQQAALERAEGEWIAVLNSDDVWEETKLEKQLALLDKSHSFSCTLGHQIDENGKTLPVEQHGDWPRGPSLGFAGRLLQENRILASSVLFRREGLSFHAECRYSGDWLALVEASQRGTASLIEEPLTFWRIHTSNAHFRSAKQVAEEIAVRGAILSRLGHLDRHWASRSWMDVSALRILRGEVREARRAAFAAFRLNPGALTAKRLAVTLLPLADAQTRLWPGEKPLEPLSLPEIQALRV
ncbi:MAG: glycosyltransferase family 2 protein [Fimbriimonadaceae bacterium]|jgi:glycosyltransferase involved in cell wall biosynthesis|nr:glycosyltransferase family 2 protein [Fimbriimonadaceae bacterium]